MVFFWGFRVFCVSVVICETHALSFLTAPLPPPPQVVLHGRNSAATPVAAIMTPAAALETVTPAHSVLDVMVRSLLFIIISTIRLLSPRGAPCSH